MYFLIRYFIFFNLVYALKAFWSLKRQRGVNQIKRDPDLYVFWSRAKFKINSKEGPKKVSPSIFTIY